MYQEYDIQFTHKKMGLAMKVSRELLEDDLFNIIANKPRRLADAIARKIEYDAADVFNKPESTYTGADGSYLASTTHPRPDGGTAQSNKTTSALSETSLETIFTNMAGILDGQGQKIMIQPDLLVVPINLENAARILMESTGRVGGDLNDVNPYKNRLEVFVWNWLTDVNNYFVIDKRLNALDGMRFIWRKKVQLERDDNVSAQIAR